GDAPIRSIANIRMLQDDARYSDLAAHVHLLPLSDPRLVAEYPRTTVSYPGFADSVETIAIRPTLVSYNFAGKASSYYRMRCNTLRTIGVMIRNRLHKLQSSGHPKWQEATWSPEAGSWQKDPCFFGDLPLSTTRRTP
ncbi:MAG: hypothetical protein OEU26_27405, partial [Candidatus Tectomicrobia bacterium]|nr:hypothetical protein [Candidatus Tectomicrobia bacterium]